MKLNQITIPTAQIPANALPSFPLLYAIRIPADLSGEDIDAHIRQYEGQLPNFAVFVQKVADQQYKIVRSCITPGEIRILEIQDELWMDAKPPEPEL